MPKAIDYEKIDEPMRGLVKLLNDNNFIATSSCQGGEGHAFPLPTIVFEDMYDSTCDCLVTLLLGCDYRSFTISKCGQFQKDNVPIKEYVTLEFWNLEDVIGIRTPHLSVVN